MQAILLAAGFGTRLKPYTTLRPKPLFPVQNKPLLHILLQKLRQAGCTRIIVNAHHLATQVAAALEGWEEAILQYEPEIDDSKEVLPITDLDEILENVCKSWNTMTINTSMIC